MNPQDLTPFFLFMGFAAYVIGIGLSVMIRITDAPDHQSLRSKRRFELRTAWEKDPAATCVRLALWPLEVLGVLLAGAYRLAAGSFNEKPQKSLEETLREMEDLTNRLEEMGYEPVRPKERKPRSTSSKTSK